MKVETFFKNLQYDDYFPTLYGLLEHFLIDLPVYYMNDKEISMKMILRSM